MYDNLMKYKLNILQKVGLILVGLILITFFVQFIIYCVIRYRKKYEKIQEGMSISSLFNNVLSGIEDIGTNLENLGKIIEVIALLPIEMMDLANGISAEFACGQASVNDGFKYGWQTFSDILYCCYDKLQKVGNGKCVFYYAVDVVWGTFYTIFILLPISIIDTIFGIDLLVFINILYDLFILPIDTICFDLFGFYIFRWSDAIIQQCYRCTGGKTVEELAQYFNCTNDEISSGIDKIVTAIIPNTVWMNWFNGSTQIY